MLRISFVQVPEYQTEIQIWIRGFPFWHSDECLLHLDDLAAGVAWHDLQMSAGQLLRCAIACLALVNVDLGIVDCVAGTSDPRIPREVRYKSAYINLTPRPPEFTSAMLWGIAIADTRLPGFENAEVEIARTQLTCRVDGRDVTLNDDRGNVRGGLYRRYPWFGTDAHDAMPLAYSNAHSAVILRVGERPDVVWHFWAASPRASLPAGNLRGCTVIVRAKISRGALLQVGFDYWRNSAVGYGTGGNNHEAGASNWYFPSDQWQEAEFTDIATSSGQ